MLNPEICTNVIYINSCPTRCNRKQSIYYCANSLYTFRVSTTPIIRSTQNCNYSLRCSSGIYPSFHFCLPKPGHTIGFTYRRISSPLYVRQLVESDRNLLALRRERLSVALLGLAHNSYWTVVCRVSCLRAVIDQRSWCFASCEAKSGMLFTEYSLYTVTL